MKNILLLLIVIILVLGGLQAVAFPPDLVDEKNNFLTKGSENPTPLGDELDQEQTEFNNYLPIGDAYSEYWQIAQQIVPSKEVVTRVELLIAKSYTAAFPYKVAIRESLTGENLAEVSVPPQDIPNDPEWVEFDFDDIQAIPGHFYYIVSSTNDSGGNQYYWGGAAFTNPYKPGSGFTSIDGGETWTEEEAWDCCFKTYGKDKLDLDPQIKGGIGVKLVVENIGSTTAEVIDYSINVKGGLLNLINVSTDGAIGKIEVGEKEKVRADSFIGLGPIEVTATAELYEIKETGFVFLFFVII